MSEKRAELDSKMAKSSATPSELVDIGKKLQDDGLDPHCSDEEKIRHLWHLHIRSEASLKASLESIEELRKQQAEEMKEVENYVEHIRNLSDEREALTLEFETENEQLKAEIETLKESIQNGVQNEESTQMLLQQGLDEIAHGTTGEQIAYLLVERARLLDELEAEQIKAQSVATESSKQLAALQQTLDEERQNFDEESAEHQRKLQDTKDQMKKAHEKEVDGLLDENERLQEQISAEKNQVKELNVALENQKFEYEEKQLQEDEEKTKLLRQMEGLQENSKETEDVIERLTFQVTSLEKDNKSLTDRIDDLLMELEDEAQLHKKSTQGKDESIESLRDQIQQYQAQITQLTANKQSLLETQRKLEQSLDELKRELDTAVTREKDLTRRNENLQSNGEEIQTRQIKEISDLRSRCQTLQHDLSTSQDAVEAERNARQDMELKVRKAERMLETQNRNAESEQEVLKSKIRSLELKLESMQYDLAGSEQDVANIKYDYDKMLSEVKSKLVQAEDGLAEEVKARQRRESELKNYKVTAESSQQDIESRLRKTEAQLQDVCSQLEVTMKERESLGEELEQSKRQLSADAQVARENLERIHMLEKASQQLEADNKELAEKLAESLAQIAATGHQLQEEQRKNTDYIQTSENKLHEAHEGMSAVRVELENMREDIRNKQQELEKLKTENSNNKMSSRTLADDKKLLENQIENLQMDLNQMKLKNSDITSKWKTEEAEVEDLKKELDEAQRRHREEISALNKNIEELQGECRELRIKIGNKEEELFQVHHEASRVRSSGSKLENDLEHEMKLRRDLENRNELLEEEMTKVWNQMKELLEKISSLETSNEHLQEELERQATASKHMETMLTQKNAEQNADFLSMQNKATAAEKKLYEMQGDLEESLTRLQGAEQKLREGANLRLEVQAKKDEIMQLRNLLQEERLQRSVEKETNLELAKQISSVQSSYANMNDYENSSHHYNHHNHQNNHNHILPDSHTSQTVTNRVSSSDKFTQTFMMKSSPQQLNNRVTSLQTLTDINDFNEYSKQALIEQVALMQTELETLQGELVSAADQYEKQLKKYDEQKDRHRKKLNKAREMFTTEKLRLRNEIDRLADDLHLSKCTLNKETEWREKLEENYKAMISEKRELLSKNTEQEETVRDTSRSLSMLQARSKYLEHENAHLQEQFEVASKQRHELERAVNEIKQERQKETLYKSMRMGTLTSTGGMSSLASTWDHNHLLEAILSPRSPSPMLKVNGLGHASSMHNLHNSKSEHRSFESVDS